MVTCGKDGKPNRPHYGFEIGIQWPFLTSWAVAVLYGWLAILMTKAAVMLSIGQEKMLSLIEMPTIQVFLRAEYWVVVFLAFGIIYHYSRRTPEYLDFQEYLRLGEQYAESKRGEQIEARLDMEALRLVGIIPTMDALEPMVCRVYGPLLTWNDTEGIEHFEWLQLSSHTSGLQSGNVTIVFEDVRWVDNWTQGRLVQGRPKIC
jgi:hypothetical protein